MDSNDKKRFEIKEESGQAGGAGSLSIARHVQFQAFVRAVQGHSMKAAPVPCCRDWPRRSMGRGGKLSKPGMQVVEDESLLHRLGAVDADLPSAERQHSGLGSVPAGRRGLGAQPNTSLVVSYSCTDFEFHLGLR